MFEPSYIKTFRNGEIKRRADSLLNALENCSVCPKECKVNRTMSWSGYCHSGYLPAVSSHCVHFGEEPALVGENGVGNIFFANCNLRCMFCQNFQISQSWDEERNKEISFEKLANIMLELQSKGVNSIGFVSPGHYIPQILKSLEIAIKNGLSIPLIYNSNGYDKVDTLKHLDGIFDIYLPDFKYGEDIFAKKYSKADNYYRIASHAILEMYRQIGSRTIFDKKGILQRGVIIRHLVLPNDLSSTEKIFRFLKNSISHKINLSIMSQYYPAYTALNEELLDRSIRESEYNKVLSLLERFGFENGWIQEFESKDFYRPDFSDRVNPFKKIFMN